MYYGNNDYRDYLSHSAKGSVWLKPTKYIKKVGDKYYYAKDLAKANNAAKKTANEYKKYARYGTIGKAAYLAKTAYDNREAIGRAVNEIKKHFTSSSAPKTSNTVDRNKELYERALRGEDIKLHSEPRDQYLRSKAKSMVSRHKDVQKVLSKKSESKKGDYSKLLETAAFYKLGGTKPKIPEQFRKKKVELDFSSLNGVFKGGKPHLEAVAKFVIDNKDALGSITLGAAKKAKKAIKKGKKAVGSALKAVGDTTIKVMNDWASTREERMR